MNPAMMQLPTTYILAGGRSSRFPGDKALAEINGKPQLISLLDQLRAGGQTVRVVADRVDRYASIGVACLADSVPDSGPLGGLVTALRDQLSQSGDGWILLLGCDQFLWRAEWLSNVVAQLQLSSQSSISEIHAALWSAQVFSPIPGLFHTSAIPLIEDELSQGRRALKGLARRDNFRIEFDNTLPQHPCTYSFNTPEQLHQCIKTVHL